MNAATNNTNQLTDGQARNLELLKIHKTVTHTDGKANRKGFHINNLSNLEDLGLVTRESKKIMVQNNVPPHLRHDPKYSHLHCLVEAWVVTWTIVED